MVPARLLVLTPALVAMLACNSGPDQDLEGPGEDWSISGGEIVEQHQAVEAGPTPDDPVGFVRMLAEIATGEREGDVTAFYDQEFMERLISIGELSDLFGEVPDGCEPQLSAEQGYQAIAIPPPMNDDSPEEAERIRSVIDRLTSSVEVHGRCGAGEEVTMLFAIAVDRGEEGWRVLGWRDFRTENPLAH
jgi:hypothetical protein